MVIGIVLTALSAVAVALGWWMFMASPRKRDGSSVGARRADPGVLSGDPHTQQESVRVPPELTADWANRAQIWSALSAENALLADRLAGRLDRQVYRGRMVELAWRCEPARDDRR